MARCGPAYCGGLQRKLQPSGASVRARPYLLERMFPRLTERLGSALDIVVEFSTLGEYRLDALPGTSRTESAPPALAGPRPGLGGAGSPAGVLPAAGRTGTFLATASVSRATPATRRVAARARGARPAAAHPTPPSRQGRRTRPGAPALPLQPGLASPPG